MSVEVMTAVFKRYPNGGGEMLLALALADHADDSGNNVYPSIKTLAKKTRQSERSVQYQLRRMEEAGWLILVNSGNGGRNQSREYKISPDWLKGADFAPPKKGAIDGTKGCNSQHKRVQSATERVQPVAPAYNHQESSIEPSDNHQGGGETKSEIAKRKKEAFSKFWDLYPNKKAKPNAEKAWMKIDVQSHEAIFTAIPKHINSVEWKKDDGQFIPHPATWLNAERWEDDVTPYQQESATKGGSAWWLDDASRMKKAAEVGVVSIPGESTAAFDARIREAINNGGKPPVRKAGPVVRISMEQEQSSKSVISESSRSAMLAAVGLRGGGRNAG